MIRHRRALIAFALGIQIPVLAAAWFLTFRNVRGELASAVQQYIIEENATIVRNLADRLPMDPGTPEFKSSEWEAYQQVIETAGADLAAGGFACLLDPDGRILCHPDIRRDESLRRVNLSSKVLRDRLLVDEPVRLDEAEADEVYSGEIDFLADGTHYVATTVVPGTELRLLVHQPEAALLSASEGITRTVIGNGLLAIAGVTLLSGGALVLLIRRYDSVFEQLLRRLKGDLKIAREIQQATFPSSLPSPEGFELAAWSEPAEETGGDTFDAIGLVEREDGYHITQDAPDRVVLLLADATGHGIGPALTASSLRAMLRMGVRTDVELRPIIEHLNEQLHDDLPTGRFVTAWLAVLDVGSTSVRSYSAGQGPILVYRAGSDEVEQYAADDPPFGVLDQLDGSAGRTFDLAPGDAVIVLSDGLIEPRNEDGQQFGVDRAVEVIRGHASSARAMAEAIRRAVDEFATEQDDDRTVVIVRRSP